jgi:hypothetical protein
VSQYATKAELAEYLGILEADVTPNDERLIRRASDLVDALTHGRYDPDEVSEYVRGLVTQGVCAQVELFRDRGEEVGGAVQSYTAGRVSVQFGAGSNRLAPKRLADRARDFFFRAGLLNAGTLYQVGEIDGVED